MIIVRRIGNIVRNIAAKYFGILMVYKSKNGYFREDEFEGPEWQFGADYYKMQILYSKVEKGYVPSKEELKELIANYCEVMHRASYLKGNYDSALHVLYGRAEFRDE